MRLRALSKSSLFSHGCGFSEFSCSVTNAFEAFPQSFCYPIWDRTKLALRTARKGAHPTCFLLLSASPESAFPVPGVVAFLFCLQFALGLIGAHLFIPRTRLVQTAVC